MGFLYVLIGVLCLIGCLFLIFAFGYILECIRLKTISLKPMVEKYKIIDIIIKVFNFIGFLIKKCFYIAFGILMTILFLSALYGIGQDTFNYFTGH